MPADEPVWDENFKYPQAVANDGSTARAGGRGSAMAIRTQAVIFLNKPFGKVESNNATPHPASVAPPDARTALLRCTPVSPHAAAGTAIGRLRHGNVGTPMYNFSIPAVLKAYIDHVVRVGTTVTSKYEELLTGKKATVILVSGGTYAPGSPVETYNVATSYLRQILGFIGIADVTMVLAGQALAVDQGQKTMDEFAGQFDRELSAAAA